MADKLRLRRERGQAPRVGPELYHNLYHRPPALTSAHQRRIGQNPRFPAPTSAHERQAHI